jgi:hypothetical protein
MLTLLSERPEEIHRFRAKPWPFQQIFKTHGRPEQVRQDFPCAVLIRSWQGKTVSIATLIALPRSMRPAAWDAK